METVVITGTNRGLGLALVEQYARVGARVFAFCRNPQEASELNALVKQHKNISVHALEVTDDAQIAQAAQAVSAATQQVDILINNAGMNHTPNTRGLSSITREALNDMINTNATSAVMVTAAFASLLRKGNKPRVVMVSSQMGSMSYVRSGQSYGYTMSKAAMNMGARVLASEFGGEGIVTITLHPGWVQTDMGGKEASLTPQHSADSIYKLVDGLSAKDNGAFYKWNGEVHEW
jgi:NAD(P)-dependent dehydrogenase (short-subunit alcohol dehydrogenase family)